VNPDWSDEELERWVEQAREKVVGSMRSRMLRDARTERSYAPIETPPGAADDEKIVETAWLVVAVAAIVLLAICFYGALDMTP
jgi:hypothetical protein